MSKPPLEGRDLPSGGPAADSGADASSWFFAGGGQAGALMRATDWAATPLGAPDSWPSCLKTTVATLLHSRHPMFLWWGPALTQFYNDAYVPSFGVGKHPAAMGQSGKDCWPEIWPIIGPQIEAVMQHGRASWHEDALVPIHRNGKIDEVYWTYGYSPVFDEGGRIAGTLVVCTETTRRIVAERTKREQQAQAELARQRGDAERAALLASEQEARRTAEMASRAKDDFLATASHELRTPLNAILGWARMLRSGKLDQSAYLRATETIERNALVQVRLIEDILDGSRIISGNLHLEIRPLDMTELVNAALDAVRPAAEAKRIELTVRVDPTAARVVGDPERLQQVVWNLVSNAIKFTPKGGAVDVALRRAGTDIELAVSDNGQGIEADFLPHVFERFRQAEGSTTRRYGGLGLGLALVRHLVEAHGGTVRADSDGQGRGATFTITLPVQAVFPSAVVVERFTPTAGAEREPQVSLAGMSVLVVDDEADARDLVATALRASGAAVTTAPNALAGLQLLAASPYDVIVSDVGMPEVDGYELMRRARASMQVRTPAIALTAYAREEDRRLAVTAGFDTHVAKPVEPHELVRLVATFRGLDGSAPSDAPLRPSPSAGLKADVQLKLERILETDGLREALRFLNSRTSHRFTGIFRFEGPLLRNLHLWDSEDAAVVTSPPAPIETTYCSIVGKSGRAFTTENAQHDDRLRSHAARDQVIAYCGVLLKLPDGTPFGTLCHYGLMHCDIPPQEISLMENAADAVIQAVLRESLHKG